MVLSKPEWFEQCANIKFCVKFGKPAVETYQTLNEAYGEACISRSNVLNGIRALMAC